MKSSPSTGSIFITFIPPLSWIFILSHSDALSASRANLLLKPIVTGSPVTDAGRMSFISPKGVFHST